MTREQQIPEREIAGTCERWVEPHQSRRPQAANNISAQSIGHHDHAKLARLIEGKVLPHLLLAYRQGAFNAPTDGTMSEKAIGEHVGEFADLVINPDAAVSTVYFENMIAEGASVEALFRVLLAPTARRLGELWQEDINSMFDVTQGLAHLQQLVRTFSPEFHEQGNHPLSNRRALLMPLPGEQHTFGISLVEEYFRREGWHVWGGPPNSFEEVVALVSSMWFDMIGFSVSRVPEIGPLKSQITKIRAAARNRNVTIMVGGRPFVENPDLVELVGADATAADGPRAVSRMSTLNTRAIALA